MSMPQAVCEFDSRQLRDVLGRFATGVVIATTNDDSGNPIGLVVTSFNSLSLDPALVLWSIGLKSSSLPWFRKNQGFAINVLADGQLDVCMRFSKSGGNKFETISFTRGMEGLPLIEGCVAHFQCKTVQRHPAGDHELYVGQVTAFESFDRAPLVFHKGAFVTVKPIEQIAA